MGQLKTTDQFIREAREVHGDKYDYSKTDYCGRTVKVKIICPIHGEFEQQPANHLQGKGCPKCGKIASDTKRSLGKEGFIRKSKEVHGDKYDYSLVEYKNNSSTVRIICPKHGEFIQLAENHMSGRGCPKCGNVQKGKAQRKTAEEFIKQAKQVHRNKYDYSKTEYVTADEKVKIICPEHGEFLQSPFSHLSGNGCPMCGQRKALLALQKSQPEEKLFEQLIETFRKNDVFRQYNKDKRYPFACDFYIKSLDLFIEYNGYYMHGGHWFDENSDDDKNKAEKWLDATNPQSDVAFETWVIRDVNKRNSARNHNLNYIVLWNENDIEEWFDQNCPIRQDWK